jgi:peptidoglycan/LPS O-acetylase OafA/YrhL
LAAYGNMMVVVPVTTVIVAHFVHLWVELPFIQWARDFRSARPVSLKTQIEGQAAAHTIVERQK